MAALIVTAICSRFVFAQEQYDVVIYGGTSAAVTAAVQVKSATSATTKSGKSVVIVSPDKHIGGMTSGGLGYTDSGNVGSIGGLSREFYHRVYLEYQKPEAWRWQNVNEYANQGQGTKAMLHDDQTMWIFEPHVAQKVIDEWIAEMEIPVVYDARLDRKNGVTKDGTRIVAITTTDGKTYHGKMFIDVTYEGDLMAAAGVSYRVGREANSEYGETWNGNQVGTLPKGHLFDKPVDPYVIPGDPTSGRLKFVDDSEPGIRGEADHRVQAYCFRMCLSDHEDNRVPFTKPEGYDPNDYELLARALDSGWRGVFNKFDRIPNHKTDTNNHGPFSTDYIGMNYAYPEASYEERAAIIGEHVRYQQGLMYFLANEPRVPDEIREKMSRWGLAADEFSDNGNWPHQIYVRESRRMVGEYVMTEHDCKKRRQCPKPVGMGSYNLDSHNVRRYVTPDGFVQNEGDIQESSGGAYGIDYGSITPKREECTNLLVPVCVSSSHISFGSIRMEPVFMLLGHSAATAAIMAIDDDIPVQQIDYEKLRERLIAEGQRLDNDARSNPAYIDPTKLQGFVFDDSMAILRGNWSASTVCEKFVGDVYLHDGNEQKGKKAAAYMFVTKQPGTYEVRVSYSPNANRATNVPITIRHKNGETTVKLNQRKAPAIDGLFESLGEFEFAGSAVVVISNAGTDGHVIADAVQLLPK